jgi:type IV secretory pathway TraG/TraD family ATPase VirD4
MGTRRSRPNGRSRAPVYSRTWGYFSDGLADGISSWAASKAPSSARRREADKGTAIVVPNALLFTGSLLCQDIKGELWRLTAGFRQRMGQQCFRVNPLDPRGDTARTNPLSYVSPDPNLRISGLQRIAATLFPEVPGTDPFWTAGGRGMFLGLSLYVLETPSLPPTLGEVLRQGMASDAEGFSAHWKRIISRPAEWSVPAVGTLRARHLRHCRPGAGDGELHSQDLHQPAGSLR